MEHDYMKQIRNAKTIQEISVIVSGATSDYYDGIMSDKAIEEILDYAMSMIRAIRATKER